MYKQTLYKILDSHIKPKVIKRLNRYKKWEYGYNEDHDVLRVTATVKENPEAVEAFAIQFDDQTMRMAWDKTIVELPIEY